MTKPMPTVDYNGKTYSLLSRDTQAPDLQAMDRIAALVWLTRNTKAKGYQRATNPLTGYAGTVSTR
jgi:hypothetical protein